MHLQHHRGAAKEILLDARDMIHGLVRGATVSLKANEIFGGVCGECIRALMRTKCALIYKGSFENNVCVGLPVVGTYKGERVREG